MSSPTKNLGFQVNVCFFVLYIYNIYANVTLLICIKSAGITRCAQSQILPNTNGNCQILGFGFAGTRLLSK